MQADRGRVIGFFSERIQFELNPRYALGLGLQTSNFRKCIPLTNERGYQPEGALRWRPLCLPCVHAGGPGVGQATAARWLRLYRSHVSHCFIDCTHIDLNPHCRGSLKIRENFPRPFTRAWPN